MILLSVGTQIPFDRLVIAVDKWACKRGRDDVRAQIGSSKYKPVALQPFGLIDPEAFLQLQREASVIVSHAGMGSIITALEMGKPIIIMARDHNMGEHRNAHQFATAARFMNTPGVYVAKDENELITYLDRMGTLVASPLAASTAPASFVNELRAYLDSST